MEHFVVRVLKTGNHLMLTYQLLLRLRKSVHLWLPASVSDTARARLWGAVYYFHLSVSASIVTHQMQSSGCLWKAGHSLNSFCKEKVGLHPSISSGNVSISKPLLRKVFLFVWHSTSTEPARPFCRKASWVLVYLQTYGIFSTSVQQASAVHVSGPPGKCWGLSRP